MSRKQDEILKAVNRANDKLAGIAAEILEDRCRRSTIEMPCRVTSADVVERFTAVDGTVALLRIEVCVPANTEPRALCSILRKGKGATLTVRL